MLDYRSHFFRSSEIGLLQHEHDVLFPPMTQHTQKVPGGCGPGINHREDEDDKVGKWYKASGDVLVAGNDGIGSGSIDYVEVFQEFDRQIALGNVFGDGDISGQVRVFEYVDFIGRRKNIDPAKFSAEQRIEERRLTGLHLTDCDEQKRIIETGSQAL